MRIFLSSTTGFGNLNGLKGSPYYILQPGSVLIFLYLILDWKTFLYSITPENTCSFYMKFWLKKLRLVSCPSFLAPSLIKKIAKNSNGRLEINKRMRKKRMQNTEFGMKESKFTLHLKFLIAQFFSKMDHHF